MDRREFLASGVALAVAGILRAPLSRPTPARRRPGAGAVRCDLRRHARASPQTATSLGLDTGPHAAAGRASTIARRPGACACSARSAHAWPKVQAIDARSLAGRDRSDFETVAWIAAISREIAAQPVRRGSTPITTPFRMS